MQTQRDAKYLIFIFKIVMKTAEMKQYKCLDVYQGNFRCQIRFIFSHVYDPLEKKTMSRKRFCFDTETRESLGVPPTPNSPPSSSARVMFMWVNRGCQANISTYFSPAKQQKLFVFLNCRICDNMLWANSLNKTRRRNNFCLTSTTLYFNISDYSL